MAPFTMPFYTTLSGLEKRVTNTQGSSFLATRGLYDVHPFRMKEIVIHPSPHFRAVGETVKPSTSSSLIRTSPFHLIYAK